MLVKFTNIIQIFTILNTSAWLIGAHCFSLCVSSAIVRLFSQNMFFFLLTFRYRMSGHLMMNSFKPQIRLSAEQETMPSFTLF